MKEITLQELLNLADPAAHDGIGDLWNQKPIHYLVVFTSENEDFEIIGSGPTLPCPTLDAAEQHTIPGKKPEFFVKCPGALAGRLQPKLAPGQLGMRSTQPTPTPTLKGRTSVPFPRPQPPASNPSPAETVPMKAEVPVSLDEREKTIKRREQELIQLEENLKAREAMLRDREAAVAALEERLRNAPRSNA